VHAAGFGKQMRIRHGYNGHQIQAALLLLMLLLLFATAQAQLHPDAHEEGGLACNDKQLLIEMRE
jgi:hypothetical protein